MGPSLGSYAGSYLRCGTETNGTEDFAVRVFDTGLSTSASTTLTVNSWNWLGLVYDAAADELKVYLNNALLDTIASVDLSTANFAVESLGSDSAVSGSQQGVGLAYERVWQAALTQTELLAEACNERPVRTTNLLSASPLDSRNDLGDRSGNDRDWTATGTIDSTGTPLNGPGVAFRAVSAVATGTTSLTIDKPAGTADNDIMIMTLSHQGAGFATVPAGWNLIQQDIQGSTRGEMYWKRASSEGANYSVTGLATAARGVIASYTGGLTVGSPVLTSSVGKDAGSTTTGAPTISTTIPDCLLVHGLASGGNEGSSVNVRFTSLYGIIGVLEDETTSFLVRSISSGAAGISIAYHHGMKIVPSATGVSRVTRITSALDGEHVAIMAAIIPQPTVTQSGSKFYLSKKYPSFLATGDVQGSWTTSAEGGSSYGTPHITWQLSRSKSDAGHHELVTGLRNQDTSNNILFGRFVSKPLAAQTIDGTFDLMMQNFVDRNDSSVGNPIPTAVYRVHIYIAQGDTLTPRATILNQYVDGVNWAGATATFQALSSAQSLTPTACEEGDRVVVEVGCRASVPSPYPSPIARPPNQYGIFKMNRGATNNLMNGLHVAGPAYQDGTASSTDTLAPFMSFSKDLAELTSSEDAPTNISAATATEMSELPYETTIKTAHVLNYDRAVWFKWTADEDARVFFHVMGSNYAMNVRVFDTDPPSGGGFIDNVSWNNKQYIVPLSYNAIDAVEGTTYYIQVRHIPNNFNAPASGGFLKFSAFKKIPLADNDVITTISGHIARFTKDGVLADFTGDLGSTVTSGLAIDYTKRPMDDLNGGTHSEHRLYVGIFNLDYVEILDLATFNLGEFEVDFLSDVLDSDNQNLSSLTINSDGQLAISYWGNGFTSVADNGSFLADIATLDSATFNVTDVTFADNQAGAPFAAATVHDGDLEAGGVGYVEYAANGQTVLYTSGGWYFPIGGTQVKQFNIAAGTQSPDFAMVTGGPGVNPGVKGIFPLADGGILLCRGGEVVRLNGAGSVILTYTPSQTVRYFSDVETASDGLTFWALDSNEGVLYKFDLNSGEELLRVPTYMGFNNSTSLVVYRLSVTIPIPTLRRWALHRFDIKIRQEEVA